MLREEESDAEQGVDKAAAASAKAEAEYQASKRQLEYDLKAGQTRTKEEQERLAIEQATELFI